MFDPNAKTLALGIHTCHGGDACTVDVDTLLIKKLVKSKTILYQIILVPKERYLLTSFISLIIILVIQNEHAW